MQLAGNITMMKTSLVDGKANYVLSLGGELIEMNSLVGRQIELSFSGDINLSLIHISEPTRPY